MPRLRFSGSAAHVWDMQVDMNDPDERWPWPHGGIILKDVKHDDYHLAKDIRVARIWVFGHDGEKEVAEDFKLFWRNAEVPNADAQFELIEFRLKSDHKKVNAEEDQVHRNAVFARYAPVGYIVAKYQVIHRPDSHFFKPGDPPFFLEQRMLFCDYGRNPAHEPGAVLDAARLFPLTSFYTENPKVLRVRVDYRMNMGLDVFLKPQDYVGHPLYFDEFPVEVHGLDRPSKKIPVPFSLERAVSTILKRLPTDDELITVQGRPNQAGVFRDDEDLIGYAVGLVEQTRKDLLDDLFYAGEKPIPWELVGDGLINGFPGRGFRSDYSRIDALREEGAGSFRGEMITWDNIHIWGGFDWSDGRTTLPSSPGAFHACHLHWRWGYVSGHPNISDWIKLKLVSGSFGAFGAPQFQGVRLMENWRLGGPLIDPSLKIQSISFAITRSTPAPPNHEMWLPKLFPSSEKFEDLYEVIKSPRQMNDGHDMVLGLKFDAIKRKSDRVWSGTFFIHGFYFAHNVEPGNAMSPAGETEDQMMFQYGGGKLKFSTPGKVPKILTRDADGDFLEKAD